MKSSESTRNLEETRNFYVEKFRTNKESTQEFLEPEKETGTFLLKSSESTKNVKETRNFYVEKFRTNKESTQEVPGTFGT